MGDRRQLSQRMDQSSSSLTGIRMVSGTRSSQGHFESKQVWHQNRRHGVTGQPWNLKLYNLGSLGWLKTWGSHSAESSSQSQPLCHSTPLHTYAVAHCHPTLMTFILLFSVGRIQPQATAIRSTLIELSMKQPIKQCSWHLDLFNMWVTQWKHEFFFPDLQVFPK